MLPNMSSKRPKVLLNRWRKWMSRTPFPIEVLEPAREVACALRSYILCRGKCDEEVSRRTLAESVARFNAAYFGEHIEASAR